MVSVASGTVERITARICFKVLRAGSETPARYSSTVFGVAPVFAGERRRAGLAFFMGDNTREKIDPKFTPQTLCASSSIKGALPRSRAARGELIAHSVTAVRARAQGGFCGRDDGKASLPPWLS